MPTYKKKIDFFDSEQGISTRKILEAMEQDTRYNTASVYTANNSLHPDHVLSFTDKHMEYLKRHQNVNVEHYISNLRLITRIN